MLRWITVGLGIVCILLLIYLAVLRRMLRTIGRELKKNREQNYNRRLTVPLFDRALDQAVSEINRSLDHQHQLKYTAMRAENNLRQSIADIAHDLRTPMTVIKGNLQLIAGSAELSPENTEYLNVCSEKAESLRRMADEFFELSLLESDSKEVALKKVNLTNMLMQFLADHEAVIRAYALEPEVILPEKTVTVYADRQMLLRMLENLLNNTLRYAQARFTVRLEQDGIVFANPFAAEAKPDPERMFDRSYRAETARSTCNAGLGLYIVRLLAEKQRAAAEASVENGILTLRLRFQTAAE